jgi:hypothetical protein
LEAAPAQVDQHQDVRAGTVQVAEIVSASRHKKRQDNLGGESAGSRIKPRPPADPRNDYSFDLSGACFADSISVVFYAHPIQLVGGI